MYLELKDQNRIFTPDRRAVIYHIGKGKCALCGIEVSEESFEADHIKPWSKRGRTMIANGQILCSGCNHSKSNKHEEPEEQRRRSPVPSHAGFHHRHLPY